MDKQFINIQYLVLYEFKFNELKLLSTPFNFTRKARYTHKNYNHGFQVFFKTSNS